MNNSLIILVFLVFINAACGRNTDKASYVSDLEFLKKYTNAIELVAGAGKQRVLIAPKYQGRVMTSTCEGLQGNSNGWINREFIVQGVEQKGGNPYGGEDRLWLGPLGGQHSLYYQQIKPLSEDNWYVPDALSRGEFKIVEHSDTHVLMQKEIKLKNFIGTTFNLKLRRNIELIEERDVWDKIGVEPLKSVSVIGYKSKNSMVNIGSEKWSKESGLLSLWSMGMFRGSNKAWTVIPLRKGNKERIVSYFGHLGRQRLSVEDKVLKFKSDGKYRSKVGVPSEETRPFFFAIDSIAKRLTLVRFQFNPSDTLYFNSHVTIQGNPYQGDVISVYNNGSMDYSPIQENGFYELESTSSMKELRLGESLSHAQEITHFSGDLSDLSKLAAILLNQK